MNTRYRCIVADPPWAYKTRMSGTLIPGATNTPAMKAAPMPYPTMTVARFVFLRKQVVLLDAGFAQRAIKGSAETSRLEK